MTYNLDAAIYNRVAFTMSIDGTALKSVFPNGYGTELFYLSSFGVIDKCSLSTAYDVSTASYDGSVFFIKHGINVYEAFFNNNGTALYCVENDTCNIYEYALEVEYDLMSADEGTPIVSFAPTDTYIRNIIFNNDGTILYVLICNVSGTPTVSRIDAVSLGTAYDVNSYLSTNTVLDLATVVPNAVQMSFINDGTTLCVLSDDGKVYTYHIVNPYDITYISTYLSVVNLAELITPSSPTDACIRMLFNHDDSVLYMFFGDKAYEFTGLNAVTSRAVATDTKIGLLPNVDAQSWLNQVANNSLFALGSTVAARTILATLGGSIGLLWSVSAKSIPCKPMAVLGLSSSITTTMGAITWIDNAIALEVSQNIETEAFTTNVGFMLSSEIVLETVKFTSIDAALALSDGVTISAIREEIFTKLKLLTDVEIDTIDEDYSGVTVSLGVVAETVLELKKQGLLDCVVGLSPLLTMQTTENKSYVLFAFKGEVKIEADIQAQLNTNIGLSSKVVFESSNEHDIVIKSNLQLYGTVSVDSDTTSSDTEQSDRWS